MDNIEAVRGLSTDTVSALRYNSSDLDIFESTYAIASCVRKQARVLDIGCGTGSISKVLIDATGCELLGIEPNRERADAARALGLDVHTGIYDAAFAATHGLFDHIIFADVLEHLDDPYALLVAAQASLKPDGTIIASIPNVAHWTVRRDLLLGRFDYKPTGIMDATHLRWFTLVGVRRLFDSADYEIERELHSAGAWMSVYNRFPFSLLSHKIKRIYIFRLGKWWHEMFACQHIIAARHRTV